MNKLGILIRLRADESFQLSVAKHEKNPKNKVFRLVQKLLTAAIGIVIYVLLFVLAEKLAKLGYVDMLPATGYVLTSVVTLVLTLMKMNETITGSADAEFLLSTPISSYAQALMTFLSLYVKSLVYTFLLSTPMTIVYGVTVGAGANYWLRAVVGFFFISMPVAGIATLLGLVLSLILSTSTKRNEIQSFMSIFATTGAVALVLMIVDKLGNILKNGTGTEPAELAQEMVTVLCSNYKFAMFYERGLITMQFGYLFLFLMTSAMWYLFFLMLMTIGYREFLIAMRCPVDYHVYEFKDLKATSVKSALFKREVKQFLHSKSYLISSMLGVILGIGIPLNFVCTTGEDFFNRFGLSGMYGNFLAAIPALICLFVGISCTAYCSMSMEGKRHWIMETTPMDVSVIRASKMKLNLCITLPLAVVSAVLFIIGCKPGVVVSILSLLIPVGYAILTAWWGAYIGDKYADFNANSEQQAMRQGNAFLLAYLPGVLIPATLAVIIIAV